MKDYYLYVIIRKDLSHAQQVVQSCHAAIEASWPRHLDDLPHPSVIVLMVKNENKLIQLEKDLYDCGEIHYEVFREPDLNNSITAIATCPVKGKLDILKKYCLLK